jgi:dinuclear metal center YbgI/SA1388 family protein
MTGDAIRVHDISKFLSSLAPLSLAEEWDNVGLLLGDDDAIVRQLMTCLTLTEDVAREAVDRGVDLIVSHHPVLFKPVQRLTTQTPEGAVLLALAGGGIAVYSPHTAFDSARDGINQQLAESLGLEEISPLRSGGPADTSHSSNVEIIGSGRQGRLPAPATLGEFNDRVKAALGVVHLQYVGDEGLAVNRVGVACGSAAEFIPDAVRHGCDVLLTGEARFHACLEARQNGIGLVLAGHYATERPAVEALALTLRAQFPELDVWASRDETDPLRWSVSS